MRRGRPSRRRRSRSRSASRGVASTAITGRTVATASARCESATVRRSRIEAARRRVPRAPRRVSASAEIGACLARDPAMRRRDAGPVWTGSSPGGGRTHHHASVPWPVRAIRVSRAEGGELPLDLLGQPEPAQVLEVRPHADGGRLGGEAARRGEDPASLVDVPGQRRVRGTVAVGHVAHRPVRGSRTSRSVSGGSTVPPACRHRPGGGLEAVLGHEPPAVARHEVHRVEDELEDRLADEVVEVHPDPARLDPLAAAGDLALELVRRLEVDPEEPVAVRAGARAAAPRLDPEQVVEERHDEVVVEVPAGVADDERDDGQALERVRPEDLDRPGSPPSARSPGG